MMENIRFLLLGLCLCFSAHAVTGKAYLDKFMVFSQWNQHLPTTPTPEFLAFIDNDTPLALKLREKWLYLWASNRDWVNYTKYYRPSKDLSLQCFASRALYQVGQKKEALAAAMPMWLNGESQPKACDALFALLLHDGALTEALINARIVLALDSRNIGLARYLLQQLKPPRNDENKLLFDIYHNPKHITQLISSPLHSAFYLYGLKRLVSINMDEAIALWQLPKTSKMLNEAQQQAFLAHVALYKAMRNQPDAPAFFAKIKPLYYNEALLGWRIRFALKHEQWPDVEKWIKRSQDKDMPCWQYWLARSLEAQGQKEEATRIYEQLASTRQYYGFLASVQLKKTPRFANEKPNKDMKILQPYQPVTSQIATLYRTKHTLEAARLLNDFVSELPKDDKSALVYWIANDLQWHGKSVSLSNNDELTNQLALRFPLAYPETVRSYAKQYTIPTELVYAIIRQESAFRDDVVSSAGAHGLMQLMPNTAKMVSKHAKIPYADKKQLFTSQKNINIGIAYLEQLSKRFGKHPVLMVAAYNAGPRQVVRWLDSIPKKHIDIWIETLPWQETRNYLKNVIAFYAVYQYRLQEKPDLSAFMQPF